MVAALLPGFACAESFGDVPEPAILDAERAVVSGASAERRREFATGRHCARTALGRIGVLAGPILPDEDRAPQWPAGVVGSITHCARYRAAAVTHSDEVAGVGIDAEPHAPLPGEVLALVLRDEERARLVSLADAHSDVHWDRVVYCAKEAAYKAWFPLTRRWLGFADVSTTVRLDGTFRAQLLAPGPRVAGLELQGFSGRWLVANGLVATATSVGGRPTP